MKQELQKKHNQEHREVLLAKLWKRKSEGIPWREEVSLGGVVGEVWFWMEKVRCVVQVGV